MRSTLAGIMALAAFEGHAESIVANEPRSANGAFDLAFLVSRDKVDAFGAPVRALSEALGDRIRLRYLGPLPPYSFVDEQRAQGAPSWA